MDDWRNDLNVQVDLMEYCSVPNSLFICLRGVKYNIQYKNKRVWEKCWEKRFTVLQFEVAGKTVKCSAQGIAHGTYTERFSSLLVSLPLFHGMLGYALPNMWPCIHAQKSKENPSNSHFPESVSSFHCSTFHLWRSLNTPLHCLKGTASNRGPNTNMWVQKPAVDSQEEISVRKIMPLFWVSVLGQCLLSCLTLRTFLAGFQTLVSCLAVYCLLYLLRQHLNRILTSGRFVTLFLGNNTSSHCLSALEIWSQYCCDQTPLRQVWFLYAWRGENFKMVCQH